MENGNGLMSFLWQHPDEAKGITITLNGGEFVQAMKQMLEWMKSEYKQAQLPATMTTEEACEHFHVGARTLFKYASLGKLTKNTQGKQNVYFVSELMANFTRRV